MKHPILYKIHFLFFLLLGFIGFGCKDDNSSPLSPEKGENTAQIVFHINSLPGTRTSQPMERIKSLRIIMLSDDVIEQNEYILFETGRSVTEFKYDFVCNTLPGKKDFYIFANEESVKSINFGSGVTLPEGIQIGSTLSNFFNAFLVINGVCTKTATQFKNCINELYFGDYALKADQNGDVFLPYSASYEGKFAIDIPDDLLSNEFISKKEPYYISPLYLVPVATKFQFNFINLMEENFSVNNISIQNINTSNYLMAHVGNTDYIKDFAPINSDIDTDDLENEIPESDRNLYWIYWLAKVSAASNDSQSNFDNVNFNNTYGWISDYQMPQDDLTQYNFLSSFISQTLEVPSSQDKTNPVAYTPGIFYIPESKNVTEQNTQQSYTLYLGFEKGNDKKTINLPISNLKALFRNTYVIINVTISEGDLQIYAEIAPWSEKVSNGWLMEENQ